MNEEYDIFHQLGKRIVYLRKQRNMTGLDLAIEASLNKNYLNDIENGRRNPTLSVLRKIAIALQIELSELLSGIRDYVLPTDNLKL